MSAPHVAVSSAESHVEPQFEGGTAENVPVMRSDLVRESDRTDGEELPEVGECWALLLVFSC